MHNTNFYNTRGRAPTAAKKDKILEKASKIPKNPRSPTQQMDAAKQTVGTGTAVHKMLTLQALSSSLNAGTAMPELTKGPQRDSPQKDYCPYFFSKRGWWK